MADLRPRRSTKQINYKELLSLKVPAVTKRRRLNNSGGEKLYRLKVIEEDETRGLVKVNYLGYGSHCDEWRPKSDIIDLSERKESEAWENVSEDVSMIGKALAPKRPFNLYEDLATRIKSQLVSSRKQSPCCRISMSFDGIYFEGLIRRASSISKPRSGYQLSSIQNFEIVKAQ